MFKFYHGVDGLIRNEEDQKESGEYSIHKQIPVEIVYTVDIFHPDIVSNGDEIIIDQLYKMQIHNLPKPPWLLNIQ